MTRLRILTGLLAVMLATSVPTHIEAQAVTLTADEVRFLKAFVAAMEEQLRLRLRFVRPPDPETVDCSGQAPCIVAVAANAGVQTRTVSGLSANTTYMVSSNKNCSVKSAQTVGEPTWVTTSAQGTFSLYTNPVVGACDVYIGGRVVNVGTTAQNLTDAIAAAIPGDILTLAADTTYVGSFMLTPETGWVTIRCTDAETILQSNDNPGVIQTQATPASTEFYWLIEGCGFQHGSGVRQGDMIRLGRHDQTADDVPEYFYLKTVRVMGDPTNGGKGGIKLHTAYTWVDELTCTDLRWADDSNCLGGWNGPGPYVITDSYFESCGYGLMFGGADPAITNMVPSNITVLRNTFTKDLAWETEDNPNVAGTQRWSCKNLIEFKAGINVTIRFNTFSNNWHSAANTNGTFVWLKSVNQDAGCNWCEVRNVIFSDNVATNVSSGISLTPGQNSNGGTFVPMSNVTIANNYIEMDPDAFLGYTDGNAGRIMFPLVGVDNLTVEHNTFYLKSAGFSRQIEFDPDTDTADGMVFRSNLWFDIDQGIRGPGTAEGTATLTARAPDVIFEHNLRISANGTGTYPANNYTEASLAAANWSTVTRLFSSGTYLTAGHDGTAIGWDGTGGRP